LGKPEQLPAIGEGMVNWKGIYKMVLSLANYGRKDVGNDASEKDEL
jgi:hypothetical protein